jgi:hypothetical protein
MAFRRLSLPAHISSSLHEFAFIENLAIGAWEDVAVSIQELCATLVQQLEDPADTADKPYMTRELIATGVETIEMVGSALLRYRSPDHRQFHIATNDELTALFAALAQKVSAEEALGFLRLPRPTTNDPKTKEAFEQLIAQAQLLLGDLARYWQATVHQVRWFRHYPACLAWDEPPLVDASENPQLQSVQAKIKKCLPHLLEVIVHPDARTFEYEPLEPTAGRVAAGITRVAIQILYMVSGNQVLDPKSTDASHRLPKIFTALIHGLSAEHRDALQHSGEYFLAS